MSTLASLDIDVKIHAHPDEVANPIPFAEDRRTSPTIANTSIASGDSDFGGHGFEGLSYSIHRQVQPGAFLLGQLRSRGDAVFGASCPAACPIP